MWDWYNRPGSYQDRGNVSVRRLALIMVVAGVAFAVFFLALYFVLAPIVFTKGPA